MVHGYPKKQLFIIYGWQNHKQQVVKIAVIIKPPDYAEWAKMSFIY